MEPLLIAQWYEEVRIGVSFLDLHDRGVGQVIVVVVGDHHCVYNGDIVDLTGHVREAFGAEEGQRAAAVLKDRVEEYSDAPWEFDEVACMSQPRCA